MRTHNVYREIIPVTTENCFIIKDRIKTEFNYPAHVHPEYELNFVEGASGAQRVVGDSVEEIDDLDLVLIANKDLEHAWLNNNCKSGNIREITIQIHPEMFKENTLRCTQFKSIEDMLDMAKTGIRFSRLTIENVRPRLESLRNKKGFYSFLELYALFYELSVSTDIKILSSSLFSNAKANNDSSRINKVIEYLNVNYDKDIKLTEIASLINMNEISFCRYFRKRTGKSLMDYLSDIRISMVTKQLAYTEKSITDIGYQCGFNNLSNFNRCFKKKKQCSPTEFRRYFSQTRQVF